MIRSIMNGYKVTFAQSANAMIYFLKRIPVVGKKIPDSIYKQTTIKSELAVISEIFKIFGGFFRKALYLGIMVIIPAFFIYHDRSVLLMPFLHMFFILSFVLGSLMKSEIFTYDKAAYDMVMLMKMDAKSYYIGQVIYSKITEFLGFLLPLIIIGLFIGISPLKVLVLLLELAAFRFIGELAKLILYVKFDKILSMNPLMMTTLIISLLAAAYIPPIFGHVLNLQVILFNFVGAMAVILSGAAAFWCLWRYRGYNFIAKTLLTRENVINEEVFMTDVRSADVKLDEKKMTSEELHSDRLSQKQGYEYLNAIFFLRHRKILVSPIKFRVAIIGTLSVAGIIALFFFPEVKPELVNAIKHSTPALVFIMYIMATGERTCKAMFYNCDAGLLRYRYYREARVIISNFTSRLKRVVLLNSIPAFALCLAIMALVLACGYGNELIGLIPTFLCIICLSCFFSIHHLFMYYVIQPYTPSLTIQSPLYKVANGVIYLISYGCLQIRNTSYYFTFGVLAVTVVYMAVALIVTYRVAPKTFKLR
ncbi:MAG: hypothetical protein ABRQ25_08710 [Clostridiaceae bacterium]